MTPCLVQVCIFYFDVLKLMPAFSSNLYSKHVGVHVTLFQLIYPHRQTDSWVDTQVNQFIAPYTAHILARPQLISHTQSKGMPFQNIHRYTLHTDVKHTPHSSCLDYEVHSLQYYNKKHSFIWNLG